MKKVLIVNLPYESARGGLEKKWCDVAKFLRGTGRFEVSHLGNGDDLGEMLKNEGFLSKNINSPAPPVVLRKIGDVLWKYWGFGGRLAGEVEKMGVETIILIQPLEKLLLTRRMAKSGKNVVWAEEMTVRVKQWRWNPLLRVAFPVLSRFVSAVVSPSGVEADFLKKCGVRNVKVIANSVEDCFFKISGERLPENDRVLFVGRFDGKKGEETLIRAAGKAKMVVDFAGEGDFEFEMRALAERLGVRVNFLGFVKSEEVLKKYRTVCVPSVMPESFGMAAAEAMAAGRNVVVSDVCGVAGFLGNGAGWVVRAGDVDSLVRALVEGKSESRGEVARGVAEKYFREKEIFAEWEEILNRVQDDKM